MIFVLVAIISFSLSVTAQVPDCPDSKMCLSIWGHCGYGNEYCGTGNCQRGPSSSCRIVTTPETIDEDQCCANPNECRSQWGYCGTGPEYCGEGCQCGPCTSNLPEVPDGDSKVPVPVPPPSNITDRGIITNCRRPGMIALTFDDGPTEQIETIMDSLEAENARGTFFIIGKNLESSSKQDIFRDIIERGHSIGAHSYNHPRFSTLNSSQVESEMKLTEDIFKLVANVTTKYFRFPYGESTPQQVDMINSRGYKILGWSIDTNDWRGPSTQEIIETVKDEVESASNKTDSWIVLQHDFSAASVAAVPTILKEGKKAGYKFVTIDECLK